MKKVFLFIAMILAFVSIASAEEKNVEIIIIIVPIYDEADSSLLELRNGRGYLSVRDTSVKVTFPRVTLNFNDNRGVIKGKLKPFDKSRGIFFVEWEKEAFFSNEVSKEAVKLEALKW